MASLPEPSVWVRKVFLEGVVIPAHPLALNSARRLDERRQRALTRYYHAAGAGGVAVGVHTTQFSIREPRHGLFKPVLELAAQTIDACDRHAGRRTLRIAGICGRTDQAVREAHLAGALDYHAGLLSLAALPEASDAELIAHCTAVATELPLFGFYLQPAAGGRVLSRSFWEAFLAIPNVLGVKIAPFDRYRTLDVVRALATSGRAEEIALYTGNDDNILVDLLTEFQVPSRSGLIGLRIVGGLLGHWAFWTRKAVDLLAECRKRCGALEIPAALLSLGAQVTDCNAAVFDASHGFAGCISGIHEVLRRQGLLEGVWCLDEQERLSPGQVEEIDRVCRAYPHLNDDEFVRDHLQEWLNP
jgi:hypothetical protein